MTRPDYEKLYREAACGLLTTTGAGIITEVNDTLLGWTGHSADDVIGRPFASLLDAGSRIFYETRHAPTLHLRGELKEVALTLQCADGSALSILLNSVLNADENVVFLAVTRDNAVWRVPLMKDGTASKVGVFIQMSGGGGPDGMAIDRDGNLAVCHVGFGAVWVFSAKGEPLYRIDSPEGLFTTNCAYGGVDGKQLFITESKTGTILVADLKTPGQPMYSHA